MPQILIGTSGWHYASWWGPFFPKEVKKNEALIYYASRFKTAELNAPFYRTPTIEAVGGQDEVVWMPAGSDGDTDPPAGKVVHHRPRFGHA